jgi:hypothetical protein
MQADILDGDPFFRPARILHVLLQESGNIRAICQGMASKKFQKGILSVTGTGARVRSGAGCLFVPCRIHSSRYCRISGGTCRHPCG